MSDWKIAIDKDGCMLCDSTKPTDAKYFTCWHVDNKASVCEKSNCPIKAKE